MSTIPPLSASTPLEKSCCPENMQPPSPWLKSVDLICRIAIGVFGAILAPLHFAVSFALGSIIGGGYAIIKWIRSESVPQNGTSKPICAQGYMDFLSGMRFPPLINTLATASFIGAHLRHDPLFYVPFSGLFLGFWIGKDSMALTREMSSRVISHVQPAPKVKEQPRPCCCPG